MGYLNFRDWWGSIGINLIPKDEIAAGYGAIAENAWYASIESNESVPAETRVSQPSEPTFGQWIDVNKQLPEYSKAVLIKDGNRVQEGWLRNPIYFKKKNVAKWENMSGVYNNITHWMPLPKP